MSNRPCSIYLIDKDSIGKDISSEVVTSIMRRINKELNESANRDGTSKYVYSQQNLKSEWTDNELNIRIYYRHHKYVPEWKGFFAQLTEESSPIRKAENKMSSVICFIFNEKYVFAICTGYGTFSLQKYIDPMFGLDILTKLIDKDSSVIKSRRSRGITGNTLAAMQIFKKDQLILAEEAYGQLFKEISADLDYLTIKKKLGLDIGKKIIASCVAKSSFKLNKSIELNSLIELINHLVKLKEDTEIGFNFNRIKSIGNRTEVDKKLNIKLNINLKKDLYKHLKNKQSDFNFEICNENYEEYFFADQYIIETKGRENHLVKLDNRIQMKDVRNFLKKYYSKEFRTQRDFLELVDRIYISSIDPQGIPKTSGTLISHLNGEMVFDDETYFYLDKRWIQMIGNLVDELNTDVKYLLNNMNKERRLNSLSLFKWDRLNHEIEDDYNRQYIGHDKTLVFHKVLYQNIEMADIIKWDDDNVYLIHVKKGFDSSMRDLTSQVNNAARILLNELKGNDMKFANALYEELEKYSEEETEWSDYFKDVGQQVNNIVKDDFINLFKQKSIYFSMAILDESKSRKIIEVEKFKSNIAKLSTLDLIRSMGNLDVNVLIDEI